uniref:Uncharacterized protein n=1 Tax=Mycetohabitans sp. TaxID=2571162 RepID=A0A6B9HDM8_9BURK|nr:hypothetical protein [Mycetohabitans sp.]
MADRYIVDYPVEALGGTLPVQRAETWTDCEIDAIVSEAEAPSIGAVLKWKFPALRDGPNRPGACTGRTPD